MTADSPAACNIVGGHRPPLQKKGPRMTIFRSP
jgi:hypothetical protein